MVYVTGFAKQASAKLRQMLSDDPLRHPLGRTPDSAIDESLATRSMKRADLFGPEENLAPHRHRIAAMLAAQGLSPKHVIERHWPELKFADHYCAYCINKRRCERWLRGNRPEDAPRMFYPNAMTFERWYRDYLKRDAAGERSSGDSILESGLYRTREMLRRIRPPGSLPSGR